MRKLRLVVGVPKQALPALLAAALVPAAATCGEGETTPVEHGGASVGSGGATSGSQSSGTGGAFVTSSTTATTGAGGAGGAPFCDPGTIEQTFTVELPAPGVPAEPGQICAVAMGPVDSNGAARVTLVKDAQTIQSAKGQIEIAPALAGLVQGLPTIEVVDATDPQLSGMLVSNVQPVAGGFSFDASWADPLALGPGQFVRMTVRVTFEIGCGPGGDPKQSVASITYVQLCGDDDVMSWVSSGDECKVCAIIAEMAPSPIVPDEAADDLPLARVLRLRLVPVARVGRTVVLFAENDGGPDLAYAWHPSGGRVTALAPDVVVWDPPDEPGPHAVQVVAHGDEAAAVASWALAEAS